ncbi:DUF4058 family protein [Oscillochloris sp. ZM17-4]|uniref:DUF4058 family protein n=1 Tax=Oscillochloris sp. ZM17-4 TaxID=2866714 RepID=UPI001C730B76|nr:DUF4058 family protein [Oscillochloris sp. ZM17-4]MBX0329706.1 DUF4058 family protein [Oscillochloris sp. ZM17-4]
METPFPGMDPYLEQPAIWPDLHNSLIVALRDDLAPQLRPRYYVAIEERTYTVEPGDLLLAGRADVAVVGPAYGAADPDPERAESGGVVVSVDMPDEVRETYLEVRSASGEVVTLVEILSPTNKRPGEGRGLYLRTRRSVIGTLTHLVEIDLLRAGAPMPVSGWAGQSDYRIMISRGNRRPRALLLPFGVRQAIPSFALPLLPGDAEPAVDLGALLRALYDRGGYDLRLRYADPADPPLAGDNSAWADDLLRAAGLR